MPSSKAATYMIGVGLGIIGFSAGAAIAGSRSLREYLALGVAAMAGMLIGEVRYWREGR